MKNTSKKKTKKTKLERSWAVTILSAGCAVACLWLALVAVQAVDMQLTMRIVTIFGSLLVGITFIISAVIGSWKFFTDIWDGIFLNVR